MKHQIMHLNGAALFEAEIPDNTPSTLATRVALEAAVKGGANLSGANLIGANLSDANLSGSRLSGAHLSGADLTCANLSDANLIGARLSDANLIDADLIDSDLSGASLIGADLSGSRLSGANLSGARLRGSRLSGANLIGAHLGSARLMGQRPVLQIGPIGSRSDFLLAFITDQGLRLRAGCFFGTRAEFEAKLNSEHGDNEHAREYRAALALIDAHAAIWTPDTGALR